MKVPVQTTPRTQRAAGGIPFIQNRSGAGAQSGAELGGSMVQFANSVGSVGGLLKQQATNAQRFGTLQSFTQFNSKVDETLAELQRGVDPSLGNYADIAVANYDQMEQEWLKTVPDEFHDEFATRAGEVRAQVARNSLAFQYESTDNYFRDGIKQAVNQSLITLDQDGSAVNLETQRAAVDEFIDSTTLTEAEKVSLRRASYTQLESVSYKAEVRRGNIEADALGVGTSAGTAVDLIMQFDGETLDNDLDYATNRELLSARVQEAEAGAVAAIGSTEVWEQLPTNVKAVLTSVHDDLGELPEGLAEAVRNGDLEGVVGELRALGGDRREVEADILSGNAELPEGQLDTDPRYQNIPYEDRLALRADADREAAAERTAAEKERKAQQEAAQNELLVGIMDGTKGQWHIDQARESGTLTDFDAIKKAQTALKDYTEELRMTTQMQQHVAANIPINPGSEDDRKMFNAYIGQEGMNAMRQLDGDYVANVLVPAVRAAGDLPTDTVGLLTGMTRAQDPQMALFALDTLNQLKQASPEAYQARVPEAMAADVEYWRSVKDYYPQEDVLNTVRGGVTQEQRTRTAMLREEAKKLINDGSVSTSTATETFISRLPGMLGDMPVWRNGDPGFTPGGKAMLEADFNTVFQREFARDGNEVKAQDRALIALGKIWNTTEIGGQQTLMRYPPELVGYETWNGSHDWITEQGRKELGLTDDQSFRLISDEQTKAEYQEWQSGGPRPSYLAVYYDANGELAEPRDENGKPQRIFFEVTAEMEAEKVTKFEQDQENLAYNTFMTTYDQARRHARNTGTSIPEEIQAEYDRWVDEKGAPRNPMLVFQGWGQ